MKKFKAYWFNENKMIKSEFVMAENEEEAQKQLYIKYGGKEKAPAPLLSLEEII